MDGIRCMRRHRRDRYVVRGLSLSSMLALLACADHDVAAADFCVSTPTGLQIALDAAATNGADDHIRLVAGTYLPTQGLDYESQQAQSLQLSGGHAASCIGTSTAPTTISGQNIPADEPGAVISFQSAGAVAIEGMRLTDSGGMALAVSTLDGDITLDRIRLDSSGCNLSSCLHADSVSGVIRFRGNLVVGNTTLLMPVVTLGTDAGHIFVSGNTLYDNRASPFQGWEPNAAGLLVEAGRLDASRFTVLSNNILQNNTSLGGVDLESRGFSFRLHNLMGTVSGDPASSVEAESTADAQLCLAFPCTAFYTPLQTSPAVDSGMNAPIGGSPAIDVYLNPRWRGLHPDRGAVEALGNLLRDGFE